MTGFLEISSGECCKGMALMSRCYWLLNLYGQTELSVRVISKHLKSFPVGVSLRQGCVLSPLLFITYVNWIDKLSRTDERVKIEPMSVSRSNR